MFNGTLIGAEAGGAVYAETIHLHAGNGERKGEARDPGRPCQQPEADRRGCTHTTAHRSLSSPSRKGTTLEALI